MKCDTIFKYIVFVPRVVLGIALFVTIPASAISLLAVASSCDEWKEAMGEITVLPFNIIKGKGL